MLDRAREWWEKLGRANQLALVLTTVGVLIALIGFVTWAGTPDYVPLFSNLSAQDANAIAEKLKESNVPSKLAQSGATIEVPAQFADEQRIKMVAAGLPAASANATTGMSDALTGQHMGDTSAIEDLRIRSAKENQVSKSLMMMDPIANAVVQSAASDNNPLLMSNHETSAAVLVTTKPGRSLSDENVHAIVRLTQMSFTGLQEKNISVTDSQGNVLWDGNHAGGVGGGEGIDKTRRKLETEKRAEIQNALNIVFGAHNSIATVSIELNSDRRQEHRVEVLPGAVTMKENNETHLEGAGKITNTTAAGATANVGGPPPANPAPGGGPGVPGYASAATEPKGTFTESKTITTTEPGKAEITTESEPGKIEKMSVSVLVDSNKYKDPAALTDIKAKIKEMVAVSIGISPTEAANGRMVSVVDMPFDHTQEMQDQAAGEQVRRADMLKQLAGLLIPFLIMGMALFLLARALRRSNPAAFAKNSLLPAGVGGGMGALPPGSSLMLDGNSLPMPGQMVGSADMIDGEDGPLALSHGSSAPKSFEVIEETFDANLESILHLTRAKPDMVAMLLKSWLSEEQ